MKSAPFVPFRRSFMPLAILKKTGFVQDQDSPYERATATRTTHQDYYNVQVESMFGGMSPKILRLDPLRARFVLSESQKGRGNFLTFGDVKQVIVDEFNPIHVTVLPLDKKLNKISANFESPDHAKEFSMKLEEYVQKHRMANA